jgi:hypothetical protein
MNRALYLTFLLALAGASVGRCDAAGVPKTVNGWVLDSACAFTKGLDKPISRDCALACARAGSPLVILEDSGTLYLPISESMPAEGQNKRLEPYAGKRVTVNGNVYERGGSHAIAITKIDADK